MTHIKYLEELNLCQDILNKNLNFLKRINKLKSSDFNLSGDSLKAIKKAEEAISISHTHSYKYANSKKSRFELGEKAISENSWCAYLYATNILKGRFELGEKAISNNSSSAYCYAVKILKSRFKQAEETIILDSYLAFKYAKKIIKGRWIEAEPIIACDIWQGLNYAKYILKDRYPEYEEYALKYNQTKHYCYSKYLDFIKKIEEKKAKQKIKSLKSLKFSNKDGYLC